MYKNLTVNKISSSVALLIGLVNVVLILLYYFYGGTGEINLFKGVLLFTLFSLLAFFIIRYCLQVLVFPRIALIYKIINDSTLQDNGDSVDKFVSASTDLNLLNREVLEWAAKRRNELGDLKKLEKYRRNYLGNISHELKTPLFSIQGYLHTLLDGGLEDETINRRYVEKAVANAERLQYIVDDLEVINKLEDGAPLELSEFNIKRLLEVVISDMEMVSKENSVKLSISKPPKQGLWVEADKNKIRQVIENLLTNSIKYGVPNGKTKILIKDKGDKLRIEVSDNGIGIAPKHLKHLFDRFYRVDKSRARNLGGSGLGLSIVKHILEAHNEVIEVESKLGEGTTFSFSLPKMKYNVDSEN